MTGRVEILDGQERARRVEGGIVQAVQRAIPPFPLNQHIGVVVVRARAIRWCARTRTASQRNAFADDILQERSLAPDRIIQDAARDHPSGEM